MLESIHNRKTGALFLASLRLGGASLARLGAACGLREFGSHLGLAFQITDDLLDHDEDRRGTGGKRKGDRGKLTFPNLIGVEQSRRDVEELVASSLEALEGFGPRPAASGPGPLCVGSTVKPGRLDRLDRDERGHGKLETPAMPLDSSLAVVVAMGVVLIGLIATSAFLGFQVGRRTSPNRTALPEEEELQAWQCPSG